MMKAKRIGMTLLFLISVFVLLSTGALATSAGSGVFIGGLELADGDYYINGANGAMGVITSTEPSGGAWNAHYYEDADNDNEPTLALKGLVLTDFADGYCISLGKSATFVLQGASTVSTAGWGDYSAVRCVDSLSVTGAGGSLTATADGMGDVYGIHCGATLTVGEGVTLEGAAPCGCGIHAATLKFDGEDASVTADSQMRTGLDVTSIRFDKAAVLTVSGGSGAFYASPDLYMYGFDGGYIVSTSRYADGSQAERLTYYNYDQSRKYVRFEPALCTMSYNANGGAGTMESRTVTAYDSFMLPACGFTAPEGKVFKAWAVGSASGTELVRAGMYYTVTGKTTFYAVWADTHAVTLRLTKNGLIFSTDNVCLDDRAGGMYTLTESPAGTYANAAVPDGEYVVSLGSDGTGSLVTVNGADLSGVLPFFTVSVVTNGGTPTPPRQIVAQGGYAGEPSFVTRDGYRLDGWYTDEALTTQGYSTPTP